MKFTHGSLANVSHLTGIKCSEGVEVMNFNMNDMSPILLFLLESFTYFAQRNAHLFLVPILLIRI